MIHAAVVMTLLLGDLSAIYRSARTYDKDTFVFAIPAESALRRTRELVARVSRATIAGKPPAPLVAQAKAAGFDLEATTDAAGELWVLHEPSGQRAGAGLFAFRGQGTKLCVQAPHTFFDQGTGDIALALFARLRATCLFVNTVHRYSKAQASDEEHPADVAHAARTHFASATEGLLDTAPTALIQVHGFGESQGLPAQVCAVVSDGVRSRSADAPAPRLRTALANRLGAGTVRLFGEDADVLGATTNVEGKAARRAGAIFLHVEMSGSTRKKLGADVAPLAEAVEEALAPAGASQRPPKPR